MGTQITLANAISTATRTSVSLPSTMTWPISPRLTSPSTKCAVFHSAPTPMSTSAAYQA